MTKYKIVISYDGTDYSGWQVQKRGLAVAQVLQDRFEKVFCKRISLLGASRTDAGVHAMEQVACFETDLQIEPQKIIDVWNNTIPHDIVIRSISKVASSFHPQHSVVQKTYWYNIFAKRPLPFTQRYGFYCSHPFDLDILKNSLELFVGTHDFRSFCTGWDMGENTTRTIDSISVSFLEKDQSYKIIIKGRAFLRYMIRRIVGAALEVASRKDLEVADIGRALAEKNPQQHFPTAPAKGLCLYKIQY